MPPAIPIKVNKTKQPSNTQVKDVNPAHRSSIVLSNITNRSKEYKQLISRNADFKKRILTSKQAGGSNTEESILEAINIIHNSIVRNARGRQYR